MSDVLCFGEVVVDWIRIAEGGASKAEVFERHLAGVPANVAVGLARQGVSSAVIGRVGDDPLVIGRRRSCCAKRSTSQD